MPEPAPIDATGQPGPRFLSRVTAATMIVFGSAIVLMLLWYGRHVLLLLFAGVLLAMLLRMPAQWLAGRSGMPARWAVLLVLALVIAMLVLLGWLAGPALLEQLASLRSELTRSLTALQATLQQYSAGRLLLDNLPESGDADLAEVLRRSAGVGATLFSALGSLLLVIVVSVFFAYNPGLYVAGLLRLVPLHRRERACQVARRLDHDLRRWLLCQMIEMVVLAVLVWIALTLLGVPLALPLALIAGLTNFIPYVGPLLGLLPVAAVAFTDSPQTGMLAVGSYFLAQTIEGNLITPLVYQRLIHIPPALTLAAQLFFGTFAGILGVALAAPLAVLLRVLLRMLYVEDTLGDSLDEPVAACERPPEEPG